MEINAHLGLQSRGGQHVFALAKHGLLVQDGTARGIRLTVAGWEVAGVRTRGQLLEELYRVAELWERGDGMQGPVIEAIEALRDFDASAERAA
jgi:hypothetical protein